MTLVKAYTVMPISEISVPGTDNALGREYLPYLLPSVPSIWQNPITDKY